MNDLVEDALFLAAYYVLTARRIARAYLPRRNHVQG